jgi:hypothetical protein
LHGESVATSLNRREDERAMDVTLGTFNLNNLFGR